MADSEVIDTFTLSVFVCEIRRSLKHYLELEINTSI